MSKKIKKIYLSAPISGYDIPERQQTFQEMETKLSKLGYQILNPMKNGLDISLDVLFEGVSEVQL